MRVFRNRRYELSPSHISEFLTERAGWKLRVSEHKHPAFGRWASIRDADTPPEAMEYWSLTVGTRAYQENEARLLAPPDQPPERDEHGIAWFVTDPNESDPDHFGRRGVIAEKQYGNMRLSFQLDNKRDEPRLKLLDQLLTELTAPVIAKPS